MVRGRACQGSFGHRLACYGLAIFVGAACQVIGQGAGPVDFARDIEPILRKNCHSCHGAERQEGGLRLDTARRAIEGGDRGVAIVRGDGARSRLIQAVTGADAELGRMPPEGEGTPLAPAEIEQLQAWIDQGAPWPAGNTAQDRAARHWAFQPLRRPGVETTRDPFWLREPIDAFVLARLDREQIPPSPEASASVLVRRLYLDLLGLPPSPHDVTQFATDARPDAWSRLVDRVLASPHHGERWGRHWLDLARYADSDGYEKDNPRPHAWRYREWVLDALNADLPFDQFSRQQIAGDLLAALVPDSAVASGFHRNTLHNTEGGTDPEEDRVKKTVDRTNTFGAIWLGLTVGCAQCHSHKYDPLTQREYFSLYAFFNSLEERDIPAPLTLEQEQYDRIKATFDREHAPYLEATARYEREGLAAALARWEATGLAQSPRWTTLIPTRASSTKGATLREGPDHSLLASGPNEVSDVYTVEATASLLPIRALRVEVLPDPELPKQGPGRASNGNFVLSELRVAARLPNGKTVPIELHSAKADFSQERCEVQKAINDNSDDYWAIAPQMGRRHVARFALKQPLAGTSPAELIVTIDQSYTIGEPHNLGRFRLSVTDSEQADLDGLPDEVTAILQVAAEQRTVAQKQQLMAYYRGIDVELARLLAAEAEHAKRAPPAPGTKAQAVAELAMPRTTQVHLRGDFLSPGDTVAVATPAVLPPLALRGERPDRVDLANWLFDTAHPLTARVTANRIWQPYFARGLVASVDDFGSQGDPPSHPELLDWLACELRDGGWQVKRLHRLIVSSATYRQSSAIRTELADVDPDNVLLARQSRRRVEAEIVRDLALAVSGLLDRRIGGASVRPVQPQDVSNLTYANSAKWQTSAGGDRYRRGLYTFFQRTSPYPMLATFDAPDSNVCAARRMLSNTPLQSLTLWNDAVFFECARMFGRRVVTAVPTRGDPQAIVVERLTLACREALSRPPSDEELRLLQSLHDRQHALVAADETAARQMIGELPLPAGVTAAELATWIAIGRTLMNLDEFIAKE